MKKNKEEKNVHNKKNLIEDLKNENVGNNKEERDIYSDLFEIANKETSDKDENEKDDKDIEYLQLQDLNQNNINIEIIEIKEKDEIIQNNNEENDKDKINTNYRNYHRAKIRKKFFIKKSNIKINKENIIEVNNDFWKKIYKEDKKNYNRSKDIPYDSKTFDAHNLSKYEQKLSFKSIRKILPKKRK